MCEVAKALNEMVETSGRITRGPSVDNVYPRYSILSLPDLHPDAVGADVNGLYYTREQYENLRSACRAADQMHYTREQYENLRLPWSQAWPTEPGWYWYCIRTTIRREPVELLYPVQATRLSSGKLWVDGFEGARPQHGAGHWRKMIVPSPPQP